MKIYCIRNVKTKKYLSYLFEDDVEKTFLEKSFSLNKCFWYRNKDVALSVAKELEREFGISCEVIEKI